MARYISNQVMFQQRDLSLWGEYNYRIKIRYNLRVRSYNWWMIDKGTWKIGTDSDKMGKLTKYNMPV